MQRAKQPDEKKFNGFNSTDLIETKLGKLRVRKDIRDKFFKQHPLVKKLLIENIKNPLPSECEGDGKTQDGEFFLTAEAVKILVDLKILSKESDPRYNLKNIFIVINNKKRLINILENLNLKSGEDAKFLCIRGLHAFVCYLRNCDGVIKCFIADPKTESFATTTVYDLAKDILAAIPQVKFYINGVTLQMDSCSCTTFGPFFLRLFAKHGIEIFAHFDNFTIPEEKCVIANVSWSYRLVQRAHILPAFLKLSQYDEQNHDSKVSQKKNQTLRDYRKGQLFKVYSEMTQRISSPHHCAVLNKRYKWFAEINDYLAKPSGVKKMFEKCEKKKSKLKLFRLFYFYLDHQASQAELSQHFQKYFPVLSDDKQKWPTLCQTICEYAVKPRDLDAAKEMDNFSFQFLF